MGASAGADALLLTVGICLAAVVLLSTWLARELAPPRPPLPYEDRPPSGLGRLVPVGGQVDQEVRSGLTALDLWLWAPRARP